MKDMRWTALGLMLLPCWCVAQELKPTVNLHGTLRGKYEYQTQEKEGRFEVRTARVSVEGDVTPIVSYKAEIDLCDEGQIKMLDAYTRIKPWKSLQFTIGQERVPFTIDAHRSPHQQYFANRSFIAKQVGNVRDVGAEVGYTFHPGFPIVVRAGLFNGSGLTNQKDFWTSNINFSSKVVAMLPCGLDVEASVQKVRPSDINIIMWDCGLTYHRSGFIAEVEYLYKHYADKAFHPVHAFDGFVSYDIPLRKCLFIKVSPLVRYDYMSDHSDGKRYLNGAVDPDGCLIVNDYKRSRITSGVTLSFGKPFISDLRINYEKYFYGRDGVPKVSERDKIVVEVMTRF
ncbi:MAG: porin [Prevotella sp.]|nr:porin [Prevotella sp.]